MQVSAVPFKKMNYEKYKEVKSKEEFYSDWDKDQLRDISNSAREQIYQKYVCKCVVFQRDLFKCQNVNCKTPHSLITMHHIKFQKNGGVDKPKNCVTICSTCHKAYHRGKKSLTFEGRTYKLDMRKNEINYKAIVAKGKEIRKTHKKDCGIRVSMELVMILLRWLEDQAALNRYSDEEDD